jgi:predicted permease
MLYAFVQDLRFALRQFAKRPGFTVTAIVVLALGLGANTAIFSVVNAFLLHPPPFKDPDHLAGVFEEMHVNNVEKFNWVSAGNFLDWQRYSTSFDSLSAYTFGPANLSSVSSGLEPQRVDVCACSGNLFQTLAVSPLLGRSFRPDEDRYGAPRVAVISYALWQRRFGGATDVIGKQIRINGENNEVVGVMPRTFSFPNRSIEVWQPLLTYFSPDRQQRHDMHFLLVVGRLRAGVTLGQAQAELSAIEGRYHAAHPDEVTGIAATVATLHESLVRDVRRPLVILFCAVSCVLLIACINVANLLLARATERSREVSIRAAMGARRGRIVRQLITESVLLSLAGGAIGAVLAVSIAQILASHAPGADSLISTGGVTFSPAVFFFTFLVALVAGVAAGLVPAVQTSRTDLVTSLKESSRSATTGRSHGRFCNVLVGAEIALSLLLLISAGLLLRSFSALYRVHPGVRVDHTLSLAVSLPNAAYKEPERVSAFARHLSSSLQSIPGVINAGLVSCAPVDGHCDDRVFWIEGKPQNPAHMPDALDRAADPQYFAAAGIPLLRGRVFNERDGIGFDKNHPRLGQVIVSDSFVKHFFGGEDPIGKRIYFETDALSEKISGIPAPRYQIIGVVGDVLTQLDKEVQPTLYVPLLDGRNSDMFAVLHTPADPGSLSTAVRDRVKRLDPEVAVFNIRTMDDILGESAADRRFSMLLFAAFAGLALLLAAVGLYGVLSYAVSQRRSEIGIRIALGASSGDVRGLMLTEGLKPAVAGVLAGLLGAAGASQALSKSLFGIRPADPLTFVLVPVFLLAIATAASYVPALRATRIDPATALRTE